jgi:uncharacterized membrane protein YfcA
MLLLITIGIVIGLVLGLTGAGGSVFAVPLLIYVGNLSLTDAMGISLGAVFASTFYASVINRFREKKSRVKKPAAVLWIPGAILALSGMITAPIGKWLSLQLSEIVLVSGFSLLAVIIAMRMWWSAVYQPDTARVIRAGQFTEIPSPDLLCNLNPTGQFLLRPRCVSGLIIGGVLVGILSGMFGVGGGFLIVPLLLMLSAVSMAQAVSTSLLIITLISASGFISHLLMAKQMDWLLLTWVAAGGVMGMILGQFLGRKFASALLQKIFAISLLVVSIFMLINFIVVR